MLRYSDQPIFDILSLAPIRFDVRSRNHSNDDQFKLLLETCISTLAIQAAGSREQSKKFATWKQNLSSSDSEMMYGLVQCTPDLSAADYSKCFRQSCAEIEICLPPCTCSSLALMYDLEPFFSVTAVETLPLPPPSPLPSAGHLSAGRASSDHSSAGRLFAGHP
ncbi:hypothetical protein F8388_008051 [Cannabis sativa]|uniref:Gnk2-homologous domain-containing protein n=1 Tax=Cannabis sativa TaxID=3483 RepID=A0A7J6DZI7_CANSA|nr:hypothetical protein F8388_008051 [Cannabis sativa]